MNIGTMGHGWAITDQPQTDAKRMFNATIASGANPVAEGGSGSVTFTVGAPGTYYYICPVPGHVALGMMGTVQVLSATGSPGPSPTIPEISILALIGIMTAAVATAVIGRKRLRILGN